MVKRHDNTFTELDKPYEANEIGLRGIIYFGIGLLLLILVTFALMWAFLNVLKDNQAESAGPVHPMTMSDKERLPPEPRLQLAPGFGVDSPDGRINLELKAPESEYRELRKEWDDLLLRGQKDEKTGAIVSMPIEEAKQKFLSQNVKAKSGPDAEKVLKNSRMIISDSSAGRVASEKRR